MFYLFVKPKKNNTVIATFEVVSVTNHILSYPNLMTVCNVLDGTIPMLTEKNRKEFASAFCDLLELNKVRKEEEQPEPFLIKSLEEFTKRFSHFGFYNKEEPKGKEKNVPATPTAHF